MRLNRWTSWVTAAGVVAGLALPSVGTFYALRLQYPDDPLLLGMAITSWGLMGVAVVLLIAGVSMGAAGAVRKRLERSRKWITHGEAQRARIDYWERIVQRETAEFVRLHVKEQVYRDEHEGRSGSHAANAERLLKEAEAIEARQKLADVRAEYLQMAPRTERRRAAQRWAQTDVLLAEGDDENGVHAPQGDVE